MLAAMKHLQRMAVAVLLVALSAGHALAAGLERLTIQTSGAVRTFQVEVVDTPETRARGLMFRKTMPRWQGMLFDFKTEQPVGFWMENTYIPLDIIFVRADGTIESIAANATPLSREVLESRGPVLGVLEINGGLAAELGIRPGDRVRHRMFQDRQRRAPGR